MSSLRRRLFGDPSSERLRTPSLPSVDLVGDEEHVTLPLRQLKHINNQLKSNKTKGNKRRNAWIFGLGGLFGILVAGYFAGNNDIIDLPYLKDMNLESILDVLPAGLIRDANELQVGVSASLHACLAYSCLPADTACGILPVQGLRNAFHSRKVNETL